MKERCIMKLLEYLDQNDSTYQISRHLPVFTAQQFAAEEHISGMNIAKPVVVTVGLQRVG